VSKIDANTSSRGAGVISWLDGRGWLVSLDDYISLVDNDDQYFLLVVRLSLDHF